MTYTLYLHGGPADGETKQASNPYPKLNVGPGPDPDNNVLVYERTLIDADAAHYDYIKAIPSHKG